MFGVIMKAVAASPIEGGVSATSLRMRNRSKATDGFGLIAINGWLLGCLDGDLSLEVKFAGYERRLSGAEAIGPLSADCSRLVEFHLLTHLVPDGDHQVEASVMTSDGRRVEFLPLALEINNESELGRQVAQDLREF